MYFKVSKYVRLNSTHFFIIKIPKKRELQQVALNNSSGINSNDFIKIYKICTAEPYSFLVNDATHASDNPVRFRKIFSIYNKIVIIDDLIRDEKLQCDINRKPAKILALS